MCQDIAEYNQEGYLQDTSVKELADSCFAWDNQDLLNM